jgi:L-lactate dehydrogenase complex protein LldG
MADLDAIVARVRSALASAPGATNHRAHPAPPADAVIGDRRAELASRFARELEAVGGTAIGPIAPAEIGPRLMSIIRERGVKSVAAGAGVECDLAALAANLEAGGIVVYRSAPVSADSRAEVRARVAKADAGLAEADYAIASTGTLVVLSEPARPSSLTLLPPASIVVLQVGRIRPDLAAALAEAGPQALREHRMTLITGPSRTADIEKRIVMGVHGPKSLDVILVWPDE